MPISQETRETKYYLTFASNGSISIFWAKSKTYNYKTGAPVSAMPRKAMKLKSLVQRYML